MSKKIDTLTLELRSNSTQMTADFKRATQSTHKMAGSIKKDIKGINSSTKTFASGFRHAANSVAVLEGPLGGTAGRLGSLSAAFGTLNPAVIGFGVALSGAATAMTASVRAYSEFESQTNRLNALVKSTGSAAGLTGDQVSKMAEQIGRDTLASAKGMRDAAGILLTFRTIAGDTFGETLRLSQDLAAVMGGDARSAALQLGKALEDPVTGLTALRRSGVSFTESERDMIKVMWETGQRADAQRAILKKLQDQIGGAGNAEGAGLAGSVDLLSENWTKLLETVGKTSSVTPAVESIFNRMAKGAAVLTDWLDETEIEKQQRLFGELMEVNARISDTNSARVKASLQKRKKAITQELADTTTVVKTELARQAQAHRQHLDTQKQLAADAAESPDSNKTALAEKELNINREKNNQIIQQNLQMAGLLETAENFRYQNAIISQEAELERLREKGSLTLEIEKDIQNRSVLLEQNHQLRLKKIHKQKLKDLNSLQKFQGQSYQGQTKQVVGELHNLAQGVSQHNKDLFALSKVSSIAMATVNTYEGVSKSLASYPMPLAGLMAAAHLTAGLAQVSAIKSTSFGGGGSSRGASIPATPSITDGNSIGVVPDDRVLNIEQSKEERPPTEVTINLYADDIATVDVERLAEAIQEMHDRDYLVMNVVS